MLASQSAGWLRGDLDGDDEIAQGIAQVRSLSGGREAEFSAEQSDADADQFTLRRAFGCGTGISRYGARRQFDVRGHFETAT
jgi:hypothetical protein